jgi:hypothetical protein
MPVPISPEPTWFNPTFEIKALNERTVDIIRPFGRRQPAILHIVQGAHGKVSISAESPAIPIGLKEPAKRPDAMAPPQSASTVKGWRGYLTDDGLELVLRRIKETATTGTLELPLPDS